MRKAYLRLASRILPCLLMLSLIPAWCETSAAQERARKEPPTPGPMLAQGRITLDTPEFTLDLVRSSQTVASLKPKTATKFDFTPGDLIVERSKDGYYHLGDLNLRVRIASSDEWKNYSTAVVRQPVIALPASGASSGDRKSTRLNSSHMSISYAVFCVKKKTGGMSYVNFILGLAMRVLGLARHDWQALHLAVGLGGQLATLFAASNMLFQPILEDDRCD